MASRDSQVICLFDVDGTLAKSMNKATPEMLALIRLLRGKVLVGVVGGSNIGKQKEQLGSACLDDFDYFFSENGLCAWKDGKVLATTSIKDYLGEKNIKELVNFCLRYIADLDIPVKRGTFFEFRQGMINICPIGRNCCQEERDAFEQFDNKAQVRAKFVAELKKRFGERMGLQFSIGGQISFDVFPIGWDKTYCLRYLEHIPTVHFFGDKTMVGGNDYEIYSHPRTIGHAVTDPAHTMRLLRELFFKEPPPPAAPVVSLAKQVAAPPIAAQAASSSASVLLALALLALVSALIMQQPGF